MTTSFHDLGPSVLCSHSARRVLDRRRAGDEATVDVPAEPAGEGQRKPELPSVRAVGAQIEAGSTQPSRHQVFAPVTGLKYPQRRGLELPALVFRHGEIVVLDIVLGIRGRGRTC